MSRIQAAKQRASIVKRGLVVVAAAGMLVAGLLARATNPGHAAARASRSNSSSTASSSNSQSDSSDDFSIAPSTSQPQVQTGVS
jgi:adenine/guanine phosphoribosyltransferase-like PRPP-binding protein